jgi:hypothetical protein
MTNFGTNIFTKMPTVHRNSIGNHDMKIIDCMDITHGLFSNATMKNIMGFTTIDKDNEFMILDIPN